jgi:signal transduction histidine kinase
MSRELEPKLDIVANLLGELIKREEKIESDAPKIQADKRAFAQSLIWVLLVVNVLVAIVLAIFLQKNVMSRLSVLIDNSYRLAAGRELRPPVSGGDEIAQLDGAFRSMASALAEAEAERKRIEEMKQDFVAMISHDLRTPLTSISSVCQMVSDGIYGEINDRGKVVLQKADNSVTRLIGLINDLLDMEKMESGMLDLELKIVSLAKVFQRSLDSLTGYATQQNVRLIAEPVDASVIADEDRIVQVVVNLTGNAIKFSPKGAAVTLSAVLHGRDVEVRVTDQGMGIPAAYRDSIFDKFKQVSREDATVRKGTGLGLAICKTIVEGHGGTIGVRSEEGKGSTFWFSISLSDRS